MRTLKFRAWDKKNKRWYHTELEFKGFGLFGECMLVCPPPLNDLPNLVVTQSTGLTDKNGKEAYEGDIHSEKVKVDGKEIDCYLPIVWDNGAFWIDESFGKDATYLTLLCEYDVPLNIVGNIHENGSLIAS